MAFNEPKMSLVGSVSGAVARIHAALDRLTEIESRIGGAGRPQPVLGSSGAAAVRPADTLVTLSQELDNLVSELNVRLTAVAEVL